MDIFILWDLIFKGKWFFERRFFSSHSSYHATLLYYIFLDIYCALVLLIK